MIAVFTKYESEYKRNFRFGPSGMFIRIRTINDVRGREFTGVIVYMDMYNAEDHIRRAYEALEIRQPELFDMIGL